MQVHGGGEVLVVNSCGMVRRGIGELLRSAGHRTALRSSWAPELMQGRGFDVAIVDLELAAARSRASGRALQHTVPGVDLILLDSCQGKAIVDGAPCFSTRQTLLETVERAVDRRRARQAQTRQAQSAISGLPDETGFAEDLAREVSLARRDGLPLSLALLAIQPGPHDTQPMMEQAGRLIRAAVRDGDSVYRSGALELAVLLPLVTFAEAQAICRRLQHLVCSHFNRSALRAGMASAAADGGSPDTLLTRARAVLGQAAELAA